MGHADRPRDWEPLSRGQRAARDRLQPSLLDRLMDNEPAKREEPRENAMLTHEALRAAVLRDLRWLLNTVNLQASQDLSAHRPVAASALNFGVRAMAGKRMSEIDWIDVEESIRAAISAFEPRINLLRTSVSGTANGNRSTSAAKSLSFVSPSTLRCLRLARCSRTAVSSAARFS